MTWSVEGTYIEASKRDAACRCIFRRDPGSPLTILTGRAQAALRAMRPLRSIEEFWRKSSTS